MRFLTLATSLALLSTPTVWGSEIVPDMTHSRLFGPNALVESVLANAATTPPTSAPTSSPDWTTGYGFTTNNVVLPPNVTLPLPPHTLNTGIIDKITGTPLVVPQPIGEQYFSALIFGASFQKLATIPLTAANKRHNYSLPYNNTGFTSVNQFPKVGAGLLTSIDIFDDEFFGIMRLNGPNPTVIRKISSISSKFGDITTLGNKYPSLNVLLEAGQIYELDYFQLAGIHGTALVAPDNSILQYPQHPNPGAQQRYITAPYVLLSHVSEQGVSKIVPIAIQLGQPYVAGSTAILYRVDYKDCQGNPRGPQGDWNYAKTIVNAADSIIHELNAHLVKTHLIEENVIIGTHVKLPQNHVISRLLIGEGHSLKTLQLNEDARNSLLPGVVDEVFAGGYTQAAVLVDGFFASYNWVGDYVKNDLQARGLLDSIQAIIVGQTLCLLPAPKDTHCLLTDWTLDGMFRYTYAQDAIASWNKLSTFVGTVLQAQYANDKAVAQDQAVQAWAAYLSTPQASLALPVGPKGAPVPVAPVPGFPSNFTTLAALTDAVTSALYKATVGHSVVNYPQPFYNAYIPVYPALAVYRPILNATTVGTGITTDAYIASALGNANTQEVMTILANGLGQPIASSGLADDTSLLHYATTAAASVAASTDKIGYALQSGAKQLLSDLTALQATIQARDAANPPHYQYSYFDPALVANSIFA